MRLPKLSIVTVTLNCSAVVEKTLTSIQQQNYDNIEFLVIDGKSADGTIEIIKRYAELISFFSSESDKGLYDAMNKGLQRATGDYVLFLNAGDVFCSATVLSELASKMIDPETCYFGKVRINSRFGNWLVPEYSGPKISEGGFLPHHQSIFYCQNYYKNNSYDLNFKVHADVDYTTRASRSQKLQHIPIIMVDSVIGGFGTMLFRSFEKTKKLNREMIAINTKHHGATNRFQAAKITTSSMIKYSICKIFGDDYLHQLYRFAGKVKFRKFKD